MARIAGVPAREAGRLVKLAYFFTRRQFARLTGRETERMTERMTVPLKMYAHVPGLLRGYGALEQATAKLDGSVRFQNVDWIKADSSGMLSPQLQGKRNR